MVMRLLEHMQMLSVDNFEGPTLEALNLIDDGDGEPPYSFTHIPLDEASRYSPAQVLRNAKGLVDFDVLADGSVMVTASLSYTSASGKEQTIQSGTVVGAFR
ncbi:MAG: hypothetical protein HONBIEJF_00250 [Fimbriimonadaceae bacterium]|nr:hypothetical protein [Fimbriimonadaceae bacterium]